MDLIGGFDRGVCARRESDGEVVHEGCMSGIVCMREYRNMEGKVNG